MRHTSTHAYAILEISPAAYDEIRTKLKAAGYEDQFHEDDGQQVIDMHGVAVREAEPEIPDTVEGLTSLAGVQPMSETPLTAILKLLEHCTWVECQEIIRACEIQMRGRLTHHDTREADPVPTAVDWKPGTLPGDFGPESTHTPTGGQLPPSSMDETINRGRFK